MQLPCCVALGSWDLQVKALGHMARRQAWGSTLFPQITYAGIKKNNIKTDLPLLLQLFHVVLQPRSLAQPCCSFRSAFKNYLCTLPQSSTYMTLQVSNLSKTKSFNVFVCPSQHGFNCERSSLKMHGALFLSV